MKNCEINLRDPFVLKDNGKYYLYGTRAVNFGTRTGGFDVYVGDDLENWSEPKQVFDSVKAGLNASSNWAPEVHKYNGRYYMFVTFTMPNTRRGTHVLVSDSPLGPFVPHSDGAVTPHNWSSLDGTLYVENGVPYLVFCHEHTQIIDGAMCFVRLSDDLRESVGKPVTLFRASQPFWVKKKVPLRHYVTDGPFMFRTKDGVLLMIWSTFIDGEYAECVVRFNDGRLGGSLEHLEPLSVRDGGHGMLFTAKDRLFFVCHSPNTREKEHPVFFEAEDLGDNLEI